MKFRQIMTTVMAASTLGMGTLALADDDRRGHRQDHRQEQRHDSRHDRWDDRRDDRRDWRRDHRPDVRIVHQHRHVYRDSPRWHKGQYLPRHVVQQRHVVIDHRHHRQLYAPPRGHQWVSVDGEFLLVAVATGLIAHAIFSR